VREREELKALKKREKDVERGKSKEKNVCMEKKEKKNRKVKKNIYLCVYEKMKESD
jgi:hypothetical protein